MSQCKKMLELGRVTVYCLDKEGHSGHHSFNLSDAELDMIERINHGEAPTFICKMKRNRFGKMGPVLCWPNGNIVQDQVTCEVSNPLDGLAQVKVTFHAHRLIEIEGEE